jgi:hypothetical protein
MYHTGTEVEGILEDAKRQYCEGISHITSIKYHTLVILEKGAASTASGHQVHMD